MFSFSQAGDVKFSPALPDWKLRAIDQLYMGVLNCLTLVFPTKFWPDNSHLWTPINYPDVNVYDVHHCIGQPVLQIHRTGKESVRWESMSDAAVAAEGVEILKAAFPGKAGKIPAPTKVAYSRWQSDPYSKGSYSFARVGGSRRSFAECAKPVGASLFFAGEHCHNEHNTTAHGAMMSARDTAKLMLKALGK